MLAAGDILLEADNLAAAGNPAGADSLPLKSKINQIQKRTTRQNESYAVDTNKSNH